MIKKVIGINIAETRRGFKFHDGGCVLLEDGIPQIAIAEERLSRKKYDSDFVKSLQYCLENTGNKMEDIDLFVFSNCYDKPLDIPFLKTILERYEILIPKNKIAINNSHHLAHACSAFFASPFDEALILVSDNEGNILENKYNNPRWDRAERTSVYYGKGNEIRLLHRFHDGFKELGIGGTYNFITQWIGFKSHQEAGKTMALAAYGEGYFKNIRLFDEITGKSLLESRLEYPQRINAIRDLVFDRTGIDIKKNNSSTFSPSYYQKEIAWLAQKELEKILVKITANLVSETGVKNICVAGGVGLNCVANYKLLHETPIEDIFIQPASSDSGQGLGNAFYGYYIVGKHKRRDWVMDNVYFGKKYDESDIKLAIDKYKDKIFFKKTNNYRGKIATLIAKGKIVALFEGRSEFGPRALGNRSILSDPRSLKEKDRLNKIKSREPYRPYAPAVMEEKASEYFNLDGRTSHFMLLAAPVRNDKKNIIPAVVHQDGTARVQTVNQKQNPDFYGIIEQFFKITEIPMLLNTSFNRAGEPLVESPEDAIKCFLETDIDNLVIEDVILSKIKNH